MPIAFPSLFSDLDVESLLPEELRGLRAAIADALGFFFAKLSAARQRALAASLARLGRSASPAARLVQVLRDCPTLHKLAQVVARHRSLPPELRQQLAPLESLPPSTTGEVIRGELCRELGTTRLGKVHLASAPLAEGSVAVIVPFVHAEESGRAEGVFKVLKPGIRQRLEEELAVWSQLGDFFGERCVEYGLPEIDYREVFDTVAELLRHEVDLHGEQGHLAVAAEQFSDVRGVRVPMVDPELSTASVTAMNRLAGRKLTESDLGPSRRRRLAVLATEAVLVEPFRSLGGGALFHADPHAGNLLADEDGDLVVLDWSLVACPSQEEKACLSRMLLGAVCLDSEMICGAVDSLSVGGRPDASRLRRVVEGRLSSRVLASVPSLAWVLGLLDSAVTEAGVRMSADMLLLRKSLLTLEGVIRDLTDATTLDAVLVCLLSEQLLAESVQRPFVPAGSRQFGSHISNLDWAAALAAVPQSLVRRWFACWTPRP